MPRLFAVIPAAGLSRRMGQPKLLLPVGGRALIAVVCQAVRQAGVERVVVVVGPHGNELIALAQAAGADVLQLHEPTPQMRQTVEHALGWLQQRCRPGADDTWLLLPADHPLLEPRVIDQLVAARSKYPETSIFIPTFGGRRGHPVLIGWRHVDAICAMPAGIGVNVYLRQHAAATKEVPVDSESVLWDVDTPEDYERLRTFFS